MPSTFQSQEVDASPDVVWKKFSDFHDLSWANNVVEKVEKVGEVPGDQPGAKRILNGVFHETLVEIDHEKQILKYSIDDGPSPVSKNEVSDYVGMVKLNPLDGGHRTEVQWSSTWKSDSDEAESFCHNIYVAILKDLAATFE